MRLNLQTSQRLVLSQNMRKSLALLSLSNEELSEEIQKELLENPLLEAEEPEGFNERFRLYDSLEPFHGKSQGEKDFLETEKLKEPHHWKAQLLKQSRLSFFSEHEKQDIEWLISYLDEKAYLRVDIEDLALKKGISKQRMKKALSALQNFEPVGVGARSLEERLLIQVRHKKNPKLEKLITNYLGFLKDKKYPYIAGELKISLEELKELCEELERLNPDPLSSFSSEPTVFARPDLYIYKQKESFCVIFNSDHLPSIKFSQSYLHQIRRNRALSREDHQYLREKSQSARFFIQALEQRQEQIKKLAFCLIKYQEEFLNRGSSFLKPLTMTTVSQETGMSVSTISRTVNNKYAYTPQGLISLRSFFLKPAVGSFESRFSLPQIKQALQQWIRLEKKALSDKELKLKLEKAFGFSVSRRRIAQYRSELNIPSARIRSRLKFFKPVAL